LKNVPRRAFSSLKPAATTTGTKVAIGLSTVGIGGLTALCYQGLQMRMNASPAQ